MAKLFAGRIPNEDEWDCIGAVYGEMGMKFFVYRKYLDNGYAYLKIVLAPKQKARKGNYWVSVRLDDMYIVYNHDTKKMREHMPRLYENLVKFMERSL